ncbi:50S ribosomal protein L17 [Candidatus Azambacteria bacterium]|nr:50S ribosomal protein L17 [Candidatus Azambacteria bacterium]
MRHLKKARKFHRETGQRKALMKSLATALILHDRIRTTEAKAKELRPMIEKMISKARVKSLTTVRFIRKTLAAEVAQKLFDEIAPKYKERKGGYTRIIKLGQRRSDGSHMAQIEFI